MNTMNKKDLKAFITAIILIFAAMYVGSIEDREIYKDLAQSKEQTK